MNGLHTIIPFAPIPPEEITTIFVVGFPEDMSEREFQNMFIFAPGFEAASLKVPIINEGEDPAISAKKQIIGFVKFRTVEEALLAREVLSGRKIDADRLCSLKAEMAKKNLHTKRGLGIINDPHKLYLAAVSHIPSFRRRPSAGVDPIGIDQSYYKASIEYSQQQQQSYDHQSSPSPYSNEFFPQSSNPSLNTYSNQFIETAANQDIFDPFAAGDHATPPEGGAGAIGINSSSSVDGFYASGSTAFEGGGASGDSLASPVIGEEFDGKLPPLFGSSQPSSRGFSSVLFNSDTLLSQSMSSMTLAGGVGPGPAGDFGAESFSSRGSSFSNGYLNSTGGAIQQPGIDQNPPCNTLYVGNLPNDTSEDELRNLFLSCPGYKRMSFKIRSNGPMCFVEFENVHYATQALFQLYGNYLSNSTKGGIRLSYSKNPLGIRPMPYLGQAEMMGNPEGLELQDQYSPEPYMPAQA